MITKLVYVFLFICLGNSSYSQMTDSADVFSKIRNFMNLCASAKSLAFHYPTLSQEILEEGGVKHKEYQYGYMTSSLFSFQTAPLNDSRFFASVIISVNKKKPFSIYGIFLIINPNYGFCDSAFYNGLNVNRVDFGFLKEDSKQPCIYFLEVLEKTETELLNSVALDNFNRQRLRSFEIECTPPDFGFILDSNFDFNDTTKAFRPFPGYGPYIDVLKILWKKKILYQ